MNPNNNPSGIGGNPYQTPGQTPPTNNGTNPYLPVGAGNNPYIAAGIQSANPYTISGASPAANNANPYTTPCVTPTANNVNPYATNMAANPYANVAAPAGGVGGAPVPPPGNPPQNGRPPAAPSAQQPATQQQPAAQQQPATQAPALTTATPPVLASAAPQATTVAAQPQVTPVNMQAVHANQNPANLLPVPSPNAHGSHNYRSNDDLTKNSGRQPMNFSQSKTMAGAQESGGSGGLLASGSRSLAASGRQKLPINLVQKLKKDPSSGRYSGRQDLMDPKDRSEMMHNMQDENLVLKKTNQKLAEQVKLLGVRFSQIQKEMTKEGFLGKHQSDLFPMKEVEKLQRTMQEYSNYTGGSSSSTAKGPGHVQHGGGHDGNLDVSMRSAMRSAGGGGNQGNRSNSPGYGSGLSRHSKRAITGSGLRNRSTGGHLSPGGPGYPGGAIIPSGERSPQRSGVARLLVEEAEGLRKQLTDLKDKNERLASQMEGVMSARGNKAISSVEIQFYREQLEEKTKQVQSLQKQIQDNNENFVKEKKELTDNIAKLEKEKLNLESDLRHALTLGDETETASLQRKLTESDTLNKKLMEKIQQLTSNAFISTADTRVASAKRLERIEGDYEDSKKKLETLMKEKEELTEQLNSMRTKSKETEEKSQAMFSENERLKIRLEEREKALMRVEEQIRCLRDSLPPEERHNIERALSLMITSGLPVAFYSDNTGTPVIDRSKEGSVPSEKDLSSTENLIKIINQLRSEKNDLAQELTALQAILRRESEINAEIKILHQNDLADIQEKFETGQNDREKWERLAKARENKVKELTRDLRKMELQAEELEEEIGGDVVSEAGFSDISEIVQSSNENALDIVINAGRVEFKVLSQHFFPTLPIFMADNSLMSNILIDFYEFDSVSSRTASGLEPKFDSIITCSPFTVNDSLIKYFNMGSIRFYLQAFAIQTLPAQQGGPPIQQPGPPIIIGEATLPLVHLLSATPLDPNPMVSGTLKFASKKDPNTTIAQLQYKIKLRYSILDLLYNYQHQRSAEDLNLQISRPEFDPALVDSVQQLFVQFYQVSGFNRLPANILETGRVYLQYAIPGHQQPIMSKPVRFTNVAQGTARFDEDRRIPVRVNEQFLLWAETGRGLQIGLFVENTRQKLAECKISLKTLLRDSMAVVRGNFTMKNDLSDPRGGIQMGSLDVSCRWVDVDRSKVVLQRRMNEALTQEGFYSIMERISRRLQQQRVSATEWFQRADIDKDNLLSIQEFVAETLKMPLGIETEDIRQVFNFIDRGKKKMISLTDFQDALKDGELKSTPLEQWRKDCLLRTVTAIRWAGTDWKQTFFRATKGNILSKKDFDQVLLNYSVGVRPDQTKKLWALFDKESVGHVHFNEFSEIFAYHIGAILKETTGSSTAGPEGALKPVTSAYVAPKTSQESAEAIKQRIETDSSETMGNVHFYTCMGRIIRRLKQKGFPQADRAYAAYDLDKDGRINKGEFNTACKEMDVGFSDNEIETIFKRLDTKNTLQTIALDDLRAALLEADISQNRQYLQWADEIFAKLKGAIERSGRPILDVFEGLVSEKDKAKTASAVASAAASATANNVGLPPGNAKAVEISRWLVSEDSLLHLIQRMNPGLNNEQLKLLWWCLDKSSEGMLSFELFNRQFGKSDAELAAEKLALMSEEYYVILIGKMYTKLLEKGYRSVREAFEAIDQDKDKKISKSEFDDAMRRLQVGGSAEERNMIFSRIDSDRNNVITADEFESVIKKGSQYDGIERWVREIVSRISKAILNSGKSVQEVFMGLSQGAQSLSMENFSRLMTSFDDTLSPSQLKRLWQSADKNNDGSLDLVEFEKMFSIGAFSPRANQNQMAPLSPGTTAQAQVVAQQATAQQGQQNMQQTSLSQHQISGQYAQKLVDEVNETARSTRNSPNIIPASKLYLYSNRVARNIRRKNDTVQGVFGIYALGTMRDGRSIAILRQDWEHIFKKLELGLSTEESNWLWTELVAGNVGVPKEDEDKLSFKQFIDHVTMMDQMIPQEIEVWTRQWIKLHNDEAKKRGHAQGLVSSLESFGGKPMTSEQLRSELARFVPPNSIAGGGIAFSDDEWAKMMMTADKSPDGLLLWKNFLMWCLDMIKEPVKYYAVDGQGITSSLTMDGEGKAS